MSIRSWMQASLLLLCMGLLVGVHAQSSTAGNITGTVRDPQGAAVPKAEVLIVEERTGAERTVRANEDGFYSAPSLPAGVYTISLSWQANSPQCPSLRPISLFALRTKFAVSKNNSHLSRSSRKFS